MIFTRRNTTNRWRYIAERLEFSGETKIVGLLDDGCDINAMPTFYAHYRSQNHHNWLLDSIGEAACQEIIQRCRLLRNLDREVALRFISSMWRTLEQTIEQLKPEIVLSFMVDFYPVDILQRLLERRQIPFFGLSGGILKDQTIVSVLGEYNFLHKPTSEELEQAFIEITAPTFAPSVVVSKKYNLSRFVTTKLTWHARHLLLNALRIFQRDPLNPEYLTTPKSGDDYYIRWRDWQVIQYMDHQWEEKLTSVPFDKRVFVGLQYYPEATTDYWVKDVRLANCIQAMTEIARVLTNHGFTIFLKDHPVMFGLRRKEMYQSLSHLSHVVFVPYEVKSQELIDRCKTTFTWTGTIGIQVALAGRCPVVTTTYYRTNEDFICLNTWEDIVSLPERIDQFQLPRDLDPVKQRVLYQVCSAHIPGSMDWTGFDPNKSNLAGTHAIIGSLNHYVPQFLTLHSKEKVS